MFFSLSLSLSFILYEMALKRYRKAGCVSSPLSIGPSCASNDDTTSTLWLEEVGGKNPISDFEAATKVPHDLPLSFFINCYIILYKHKEKYKDVMEHLTEQIEICEELRSFDTHYSYDWPIGYFNFV